MNLGIADQYVTAGDFNGDGKMDLASAPSIYQGSSLVHVLLGKGDGTFPSLFTVDSEAGPDFILAADVNGDGLADLLLADPTDNFADVLLNTSPTSGADISVSVNASPKLSVSVTQQLSYSIYAINSGPKDATNFSLKDTLPSGVTFVSSSNTQGSCSQSSLVLTCTLDKLVSGDSITATVVVVPNSPRNRDEQCERFRHRTGSRHRQQQHFAFDPCGSHVHLERDKIRRRYRLVVDYR